MISDTKLSDAMNYLADTDELSAELKANVARSEYVAKLAESRAYLTQTGAVEERKNAARACEEPQKAWAAHFDAIAAYEKVRAKRERAILVVDVWRTISANRRQAA